MRLSFGMMFVMISVAGAFIRDKSQTESLRLLTASDGAAGDRFGSAVHLDTPYAIVGADRAAATNGAAYIYERNYDSVTVGAGNTPVGWWGERKKVVAALGAADDAFGASVGISASGWAAVGAPRTDNGGSDTGVVYFFGKDEGGSDNWGQFLVQSSPVAQPNEYFGASLDMTQDYVIVGCPRCHVPAHAIHKAAGRAFIFGRSTGWALARAINAPDVRQNAMFGNAVSMNDDFVAVGAFQDRDAEAPALGFRLPGAVYVFDRASGWATARKLTSPNLGHHIMFGSSVSIRDHILTVGEAASADHVGPEKIYTWVRDYSGPNRWSLLRTYDSSKAVNPKRLAFFGKPMCGDGSLALAGDAYRDNKQGGAFLIDHQLVGIGAHGQKLSYEQYPTFMYQSS